MRRRDFLGAAVGAAVVNSRTFGSAFAGTLSEPIRESSYATTKQTGVAPMAVGVMIAPSYDRPEVAIARVKELGMSNCFLSLDDYIG
jgi:hypothetical protein